MLVSWMRVVTTEEMASDRTSSPSILLEGMRST